MPLLFIAIFFSGQMSKFMFLRKPILSFHFLGRERTVIVSSFIASLIFFVTGIMIIYLNYIGLLGMADVKGFTKTITDASSYVNQYVGGNLFLNIAFLVILIFILYKISKKV